MLKQGCFKALLLATIFGFSGCISGIWTGASLVYDRHNVYKKLEDYNLSLLVTKLIAAKPELRCAVCVLDSAVFHGDVLVVGHLPTLELLNTLNQQLAKLRGYRRLFNEVILDKQTPNTFLDSWITTKIRSQIFADDSIDPNGVKVLTVDAKVYLMGDLLTEQAAKSVLIARQTMGVRRVIRVFKYLMYQK